MDLTFAVSYVIGQASAKMSKVLVINLVGRRRKSVVIHARSPAMHRRLVERIKRVRTRCL